jgi:hypothetical protein
MNFNMKIMLTCVLLAALLFSCKTQQKTPLPELKSLSSRDTLRWDAYQIVVNPVYWLNAMPSVSENDNSPRLYFYVQFTELGNKDIQTILRADSIVMESSNGRLHYNLSSREYSSGSVIETNTLSLSEPFPGISANQPLRIYSTQLSSQKTFVITVDHLPLGIVY